MKYLSDIITLASETHPKETYSFLEEAVYSRPLSTDEQGHFTRVLDLARRRQNEDASFESIYHQLVHLYVLNGSRLDILRTVDRRLRALRDGQGALLLVSGHSGIGKTSLVMAFQERIARLGAKFLSGRCSDQERGAYVVWQGVARSAAAAGISLDALPSPLGSGEEAHSSRHLKQAVTDWLRNCVASMPLVILLDDLHWADADSLEMLNALTQLAPAPILFIATYRTEEVHLEHAFYDYLSRLQRNRTFDMLRLEPLTRSDIERFVTAYHGTCTPELVAYLHERAEGHPLFTVELFDDLIMLDLLSQDADGRWRPPPHSVPVPGILKQLIMQRVGRLGKQAERLLLIGAVAGESWSLKIVEPLTEMAEDDLLEAVKIALRAGIIEIEDEKAESYAFSHGLIQQVLHSNQLSRRRKRTHQNLAAQYEKQQPENVFSIAYHYTEGEQWAKALAYCLEAGGRAAGQYASLSALEWYQQALSAAEHAESTLDISLLFDTYGRLGRTLMALDRREEAENVYSQARDLARRRGDLLSEGYALVNLSAVHMRQYQLALAEKAAFEALKIAEETQDLQLITTVHANLGSVLLTGGQLVRATHHYENARQGADLLGDSSQHIDLLRMSAYQAIWLGQYPAAEEFAREALEISQRASDPLTLAGAYQNLAFAQIESGQYHEAYTTIRNTLRAIEMSGSRHHQKPRLLNLMGYLHLDLGDAQEALVWDQKALEAIQDTYSNSAEMRRYTLLNKATDCLHLGKSEDMREAIRQFEAIKEGPDFVRFRYLNRYQLLVCETHLRQGEFDQAIEMALEARGLAVSKGVLKNTARTHWFEGQAHAGLKQFDEAAAHLEKAVAIADGIRHGSLRWKARLSLGQVLRSAGRSPETVVGEARALVDLTLRNLAGSPLRESFLSSSWFRNLEDLEQNPTPEKLIYPAGLTQREVEVLRLVAQGATNRQVADALHISARTVNTHMTNILSKLGLDNRTAASAFAIRQGFV